MLMIVVACEAGGMVSLHMLTWHTPSTAVQCACSGQHLLGVHHAEDTSVRKLTADARSQPQHQGERLLLGLAYQVSAGRAALFWLATQQ